MFKKVALILAALVQHDLYPKATNNLVDTESSDENISNNQRKPTNNNLWNEERRLVYRRGFAILQEEATVKDAIRFTLQKTAGWNSLAIEELADGIFKEWRQARRQ
jgi:hypothetical protein